MMTHAHGKVLLADVHKRVDDSVRRLARRKRERGLGIQDGKLREQELRVERVLRLHVKRKKHTHVKRSARENGAIVAFRAGLYHETSCKRILQAASSRIREERHSRFPFRPKSPYPTDLVSLCTSKQRR